MNQAIPSNLKSDRVLPFINEAELFSCLPKSACEEISRNSDFERVARKGVVFEEGDAANGGYIVATGWLFLRKKTHKGKKLVTELIGPGDAFGMVTASRGVPYPLGAEALRESVVLRVGQETIRQIAVEHAEFSDAMLRVCCERLQDSYSLVSRLADADSRSRVAIALMIVLEKFGEQHGGDARCLDLTRQELSQIAGTTVETAIRVTRELEKEGMLFFPGSKKIQVLDRDKLYSCSQS